MNREGAGVYSQVKISVKPELAASFKAMCKAGNTTVAAELSRFMEERCGIAAHKRPSKDLLAARGGRRRLMAAECKQIGKILDAESQYLGRIPENLQGSVYYEAAEQCVSDIEAALELLENAF